MNPLLCSLTFINTQQMRKFILTHICFLFGFVFFNQSRQSSAFLKHTKVTKSFKGLLFAKTQYYVCWVKQYWHNSRPQCFSGVFPWHRCLWITQSDLCGLIDPSLKKNTWSEIIYFAPVSIVSCLICHPLWGNTSVSKPMRNCLTTVYKIYI